MRITQTHTLQFERCGSGSKMVVSPLKSKTCTMSLGDIVMQELFIQKQNVQSSSDGKNIFNQNQTVLFNLSLVASLASQNYPTI
jgi:hypothetical protein